MKEDAAQKFSLNSAFARLSADAEDFWLPALYRDKVRTLRTRSFKLPSAERENSVTIQHTLLGVELKIGKNQRLNLPDYATARYLQIFARLGCSEIAIPYDISRISTLADELETAWQKTLLLVDTLENQDERLKLRKHLVRTLRAEISKVGSGQNIPEFNQNTKQRQR